MIPLLVFLGAGAGGVARYAIGGLVQNAADTTFPYGTLFVNVSGSLLLTFLYGLLEQTAALPQWRALLGIGFCGGYTTFSAYSLDAALLYERGELGLAALYVIGSVVLSIAGLFGGLALVRHFS